MENLRFGGNWRRELLLMKSASADDLEEICDYIMLDGSRLPLKVRAFCESSWNEYGFDYDTSTYMVWPASDKTSIQALTAKLNADFPESAKIVKKSISDAHNMSLSWTDDEQELDDIDGEDFDMMGEEDLRF